MTKDELERIKQAYYSGLKVQIWFNGHWENFDARDYSMYSDPFSENRLYRIVGSAYADIAEKRITELENENAELNKKLSKAEADYDKMFWNKNEIISKAKEIIRMVIDSYNHKERFSFEKDLIKAEQFLNNEVEK